MLLLRWLGCMLVADCPHCDPAFTCADVAIRDEHGSPDGCDVAACQSCVDACGNDCRVLESYPPQYACDGRSWDVYDECPDWTLARPTAVDIGDPECGSDGGELLTATATVPGRVEVAHRDAILGCCPEGLEVSVDAQGAVLSVDYTLVSDLCDCACMLDLSYTIADVPSGSWTLVAIPSGATTTVTVP